jgi:AAA ATPase domain
VGSGVGTQHCLGERLAARRRRLFVGRSAEVELVQSALESSEPGISVLYIHGPGGIGKSSLLDRFARLADDMDAVVVRIDGRITEPTAPAVLDVLRTQLDVPDGDGPIASEHGRIVLLIDTYERLAALDDWVRTKLIPRLPALALTVLAGRAAPDPAWRADPGWGDLLRVVSVRNLSPAESHGYLAAAGVDEPRRERIVAASHGHPLGLALLTDLAARGGEIDIDPLPADLVAILLRQFVDIVPSEPHRRALEACALARATTEALLRDALGVDDAHELFGWLRALSFVYAGREGVYPHDLARDALDADLRWRDPEGYKQTFRRVWGHVLRQLRSTSGREQFQSIFDLKFVFRNLPGVLSPVDWESWGGHYPDAAAPADKDDIIEIVGAAEGFDSAHIAERWFDRQPESFFILRDHDGSIRGLLALLDLSRATSQDIASDPGARAAWDYARERGAVREGQTITQTRFVIDRQAYQDPSPTMNATPVLTMQRYLCTPGLSWDFLTLADPDRWNDYFAVADLPRAEGADFTLGGRTFGLFAHDFRRVPVDAWLHLVTERALAADFTRPPSAPVPLVLSQPEFEQAVKQALRDLRRPDRLARNPLMRARAVRDRTENAEPDAAVLKALLHDAVDALGTHPRDDKLRSAVDRTYLRPAASQESAAAMLGLPFSTYRRHLTHGIARIVAWLWEREVYGIPEHS